MSAGKKINVGLVPPHVAKLKKAAAAFQSLDAKTREDARVAYTKAVLKKAEVRAKKRHDAEHGSAGWFDQEIAYYLEELHSGKSKNPTMPECAEDRANDPTAAEYLSFHFLKAVAENDPNAIRKISDAVKRVHRRRIDENHRIADVKPDKAKLVRECREIGLTPRGKRKPVPTTLDQTISSGLPETEVKEIRRAFDVPHDKRGPKPKMKKQTVGIVSLMKQKADIALGAKLFWRKRKGDKITQRSNGPRA